MMRIGNLRGRISAFALAALLPLAFAACSDRGVQPVAPEQEAAALAPLVPRSDGLHCTDSLATLSSGAPYQVCVNLAKWNGDIVAFIPGYHDPAREPRLPDVFGESPAVSVFSQLGYAFATTGFHDTGLIESHTWIDGDLLELITTAKAQLTSASGRSSRFVYQAGGSQGGLGTVMAVERYPSTFHGGLAACGPIGDYRRQINFVADFRVVFDHMFKDVIPGWPVWKQDLAAGDPGAIDPTTWQAVQPLASAALDDPANADRLRQILAVTRAPTDPANPLTMKGTTLGILWYSFRGTNDAIQKLGGSPFGNLDRAYAGSFDDVALNAGVQRFQYTADPARVAGLQTSARLLRPLVTIHTTGDPIVPVSHQPLYRSRLSIFGRLLHTPLTIERYGHCEFNAAEVLAAFAILVLKVSGQELLVSNEVSNEVLPSAQEGQFLRLAREHGANPVIVR